MSIFQKHDFVSNFTAASESSDFSLLFHIFSSEVSDLFTSSLPQVFSLFKQTGVWYPEGSGIPYEVYCDILIHEIKNNNLPFIQGIGFLLGQNNGSFDDKWQESLGDITDSILAISGDLNSNVADENKLRTEILNQLDIRVKRLNDTRQVRFKDNYMFSTVYILFVLGVGYFILRGFFPKKAGGATTTIGMSAKPNDGMVVTDDVLVSPEKAAAETAAAKAATIETTPPPVTPQPPVAATQNTMSATPSPAATQSTMSTAPATPAPAPVAAATPAV